MQARHRRWEQSCRRHRHPWAQERQRNCRPCVRFKTKWKFFFLFLRYPCLLTCSASRRLSWSFLVFSFMYAATACACSLWGLLTNPNRIDQKCGSFSFSVTKKTYWTKNEIREDANQALPEKQRQTEDDHASCFAFCFSRCEEWTKRGLWSEKTKTENVNTKICRAFFIFLLKKSTDLRGDVEE